MFNIKDKLYEIYNEGNKKMPFERFRSESIKYIQDNYYNVARDSIIKSYINNNSGNQLIELSELFDSIRFDLVNNWSFNVYIDKYLISQKQKEKELNLAVYGANNDIYKNNKSTLDDNAVINMQINLDNDFDKFITTEFTNYTSKLVGRK